MKCGITRQLQLTENGACDKQITEKLVARKLSDRLMFEIKKVFQTAIFTQIQLRNYSLQQQCPCEKRWTLRRQWPQHPGFSAMSAQRNRRTTRQKNCGKG